MTWNIPVSKQVCQLEAIEVGSVAKPSSWHSSDLVVKEPEQLSGNCPLTMSTNHGYAAHLSTTHSAPFTEAQPPAGAVLFVSGSISIQLQNLRNPQVEVTSMPQPCHCQVTIERAVANPLSEPLTPKPRNFSFNFCVCSGLP